jgi:VanZ family protein
MAAACTAAIVFMSLWPKPPEPPSIPLFAHADKVAHFLMYFVYCAALAWTFRVEWRTWRIGVALAAYGTAFGVAMEGLQGVLPFLDRTPSALDMLANAVGSATGVAGFCAVLGRTRTAQAEEGA